MKLLLKLLSFLFIFSIPFYDVPKTFRDGISFSGIIGFAVVLLLLITIKNKKLVFNLPKSPTLIIVIFLSIYLCSMLINSNNLDPRAGNHIVLYLYSFVVYTGISYIIMNTFGTKWFVKILGYAIIAVSIIGFVEFSLYYTSGWDAYANFLNHGNNVGIFGQFPRLRSTFNEPSHFSLFMVCTLPLLWYYKNFIAFLFGLIALIMTFATSTFFGMAIASCIIIIGYYLLLSRKPLKLIGALAMIIPAVVVIRLTIYERFHNKIFNVQNVDSYRYNTWVTAIQESLEKPLLGYGPAGYYLQHPMGLFNWYLQVFYESGILGLSVLLFLLILLIRRTLSLRRPVLTFFLLAFIFSMIVMNHYYLPGIWVYIAFVFFVSREDRQVLEKEIKEVNLKGVLFK